MLKAVSQIEFFGRMNYSLAVAKNQSNADSHLLGRVRYSMIAFQNVSLLRRLCRLKKWPKINLKFNGVVYDSVSRVCRAVDARVVHFLNFMCIK